MPPGGPGSGLVQAGQAWDHATALVTVRRASEAQSAVLSLCGSDTEARGLRDWSSDWALLAPTALVLIHCEPPFLRSPCLSL